MKAFIHEKSNYFLFIAQNPSKRNTCLGSVRSKQNNYYELQKLERIMPHFKYAIKSG